MNLPPVDPMAPCHMTRRQGLQALGASALGLLALPGQAQSRQLPPSVSLVEELKRALAAQQPLLVMVSLDGCLFCKAARESYLLPMHQQEGLPVVQVDMRSTRMSSDFAGLAQTHEQLVQAWRVTVAPTLLFFGRDGAEVAKRMVGGYLPDFYGAYLDDRLSQARRTVRG